jgi:formamidopyrimidine-DNA glycosylase
MPELPEVETTRRDLAARIVGRTIRDVWIAADTPQPQAPLTPEQFRAAVVGRRIEALRRRGKYLILPLSGGRSLILHRRMTGNLILRAAEAPLGRFLRGVIALDDGMALCWEDQRRFGTWTLTDDPAALLRALGPEPLDPAWTPAALRAALAGRRAPVKAVLLDQRRLAGLGNIYADEALHAAGVHPARPAGSLTDGEVCRLHAAVRAVLARAIDRQGSSARHHVGGLGQRGTMQEEWRVYGRAGLACLRCGRPVVKTRVAGRGTHLCPHCQPLDGHTAPHRSETRPRAAHAPATAASPAPRPR